MWIVQPKVQAREVRDGLAITIASAVLYQCWLTAPVLEYATLNQWRAAGLALAALIGGFWGLSRRNILILLFGVPFGVVVGANWAEWRFTDLQISLIDALFDLHVQRFWRDALIVTTVVVGGFCAVRLAKSR